MTECWQIRRASADDVSSLVAFNQAMALETEGKALDSATLTAGVGAVLQSTDRGFYLVAEQDSEVIASLMVTYEWSDWRNANFWWVQSVYVLPNHRRRGLYSALYAEVKRLAEVTKGVCGYRLYVERDNKVAQQTYESLGMEPTDYFMYESAQKS